MSLLLQPVEINLPDTVGATHRHSRRIPLRDALQKEKLARQDAPALGLYVVTLRYQETSAG